MLISKALRGRAGLSSSVILKMQRWERWGTLGTRLPCFPAACKLDRPVSVVVFRGGLGWNPVPSLVWARLTQKMSLWTTSQRHFDDPPVATHHPIISMRSGLGSFLLGNIIRCKTRLLHFTWFCRARMMDGSFLSEKLPKVNIVQPHWG